jgi:uncharacterized protein (TIGR02757 family)
MKKKKGSRGLKPRLRDMYRRYNKREFVHPDPLEFVYRYDDVNDREIAAFIASSLAYGRVAQILRNVADVLDRIEKPRAFMEEASERSLALRLAGFKHRFTTGDWLSTMLWGVKRIIAKHGSLGECFSKHFDSSHETVLPALAGFVEELRREADDPLAFLIPHPAEGSACKRLNLFLRWMVRHDDVDPGGWDGVPASKLIVPLDTHMHRVGLKLGFTERRSADMTTALEITAGFRAVEPEDPVKYDFVLTRPGIWGGSSRPAG